MQIWICYFHFYQSTPCEFQSIIRVVFHDRRLQYTEHQQLEGWRWNRPGDRILDLGEQWKFWFLNTGLDRM